MPENSNAGMTIGRLAGQAGVHIETVRYYQHLGLVPRPARPAGSIRRYGPDAVDRLRFIKRAQELGFSLDQVKLLLKLSIGEHCAETRTLAEHKARLPDHRKSLSQESRRIARPARGNLRAEAHAGTGDSNSRRSAFLAHRNGPPTFAPRASAAHCRPPRASSRSWPPRQWRD